MVSNNLIVCRGCGETIPVADGNCSHCGQSIRGNTPYAVAVVIGVLLVAAAALNLQDLLAFGVIGFLIAAGAGYVLYEKRQRIKEASAA